jgi:tRNA-binding protein
LIQYEDFAKVEMRVGKIIQVGDFPKARKPAYQLTIDFGEYGLKHSSAQIKEVYKKEKLLNRLVIAVTNFSPKQIANFISEVLVLGVNNEKGQVVLLHPDKEVPLGERVY